MWRPLCEVARGIAGVLFPNACLVCDGAEHEVAPFRHGLCNECLRAISPAGDLSCPRCAMTVGPHANIDSGCSECRGEALGFEAAYRLGAYNGRLRDAVLRTKHAAGEGLAEMLGRVLLERHAANLRTAGIELVVPVPLHWRRKLTRGYNQAAAVGRELARELGVPFAPSLLRRVRYTPQQVQPSASARKENVRGAFRVRSSARLAGKTVLLVDDVLTTGNTAGEAARTLRGAGAGSVLVAVLARR